VSHTTKVLNAAGSGIVNSTDVGQYGNVVAGDFRNGVLFTQRVKDRSGLFQIAAQVGLTGSVTLRGRMTPVDAWFNVIVITQADWNTDPLFTIAKVVTMFPEMMVVSDISAGVPSISCWITE
jgi:hypothetical protein